MIELYEIIVVLIVFGFFGWLIIAPINNKIKFDQERKEFLKVLETAPIEKLKKMYHDFYRDHGSPNERKLLLNRIKKLESKK